MNNDSPDKRSVIYQDLHSRQLEYEEKRNRHSARLIMEILFEVFRPGSMLDVGCGIGTWLSVAQEIGVREIQGLDGAWLNKAQLRVPENLVQTRDLEKPFDFGRRFDLVTCLEVAEHLDAGAARSFVESLCRHGDVLLFSAAIPFQGGHHHVNEQWPDYWSLLFEEQGYRPLDFIRARIWNDSSILWWLRQNILLFINDRAVGDCDAFQELLRHNSNYPLSIVHPHVYMSMRKSIQKTLEEHSRWSAILSSGGTFNVEKNPNGRITISRRDCRDKACLVSTFTAPP